MNIRITDVTLRDGSHAVRHAFTLEQVGAAVRALSAAGLPVIEVSHGDGLGGSSLTYGLSLVDEFELIEAASSLLATGQSQMAALLIPGIGTVAELERAAALGVTVVRVATHCTEADIAIQHLRRARELGLEANGFLMMAHMTSPEKLAEQARIQEDAGAQAVYCTDSAGALTIGETAARVAALREALQPETGVGIHAHNNLGLAVANSLRAVEEGATLVDTSLRGLGAGAGNCPTEVFVAVCDKMGWSTGIQVLPVASAAEEIVANMIQRQPVIDRSNLLLGWAGVYSSFVLHAEQASRRYGVPTADILLEIGRRRAVGGQEDLIIDVAIELARRQKQSSRPGSRRAELARH